MSETKQRTPILYVIKKQELKKQVKTELKKQRNNETRT
jgi:hypothetical protein